MPNNSRYAVGSPLGEVRLRNWPAGKVAQLKRVVELLQNQLNETMAAQVDQGSKAVVSSRVPKVVNLRILSGFKNFQIIFDEAQGIDDLLFYEIQQDTTDVFSNPTIYRIPQATLTIPTTVEHQQIFVRVRCQNSKFEVGPWSSTEFATGSSNFRISTARQGRITHEMDTTAMNTWETIGSITYTPTAASAFVNIHAGVVPRSLTDTAAQTVQQLFYTIYATADFRVLRNGIEFTNAGTFRVSAHSDYFMQDNGINIGPIKGRQERAVFGSMVLPFETFLGDEPSVTYTLQARLDSSNTNLTVTNGTGATFAADVAVDIYIDSFDVMEVIQSL